MLPGQDPDGARGRADRAASCSTPTTSESLDRSRSPSPRSPGCPPTATPSTWSGRPLPPGRGTGAGLAARRRLRRPIPDDRRVRPTGGTRSWRSARRGSSTTARAASGTPARSAGQGIATAPLHLVRVDLERARSRSPRSAASRPARGEPAAGRRGPARIAVGYDSGNGVLAAFDIADDGRDDAAVDGATRTMAATRCCSPTRASSSPTTTTRTGWRTRSSCSTSRPGEELVRVDTGSPVQSVLFPAARLTATSTTARSRPWPASPRCVEPSRSAVPTRARLRRTGGARAPSGWRPIPRRRRRRPAWWIRRGDRRRRTARAGWSRTATAGA